MIRWHASAFHKGSPEIKTIPCRLLISRAVRGIINRFVSKGHFAHKSSRATRYCGAKRWIIKHCIRDLYYLWATTYEVFKPINFQADRLWKLTGRRRCYQQTGILRCWRRDWPRRPSMYASVRSWSLARYDKASSTLQLSTVIRTSSMRIDVARDLIPDSRSEWRADARMREQRTCAGEKKRPPNKKIVPAAA